MPKPKAAASGANAIKPFKSRKKPPHRNAENKAAEAEGLRKTIQRRYLRDSDRAKIEESQGVGNQKLLQKKEKNQNDKRATDRGKKRDRTGKVIDHNDNNSTERNDKAPEKEDSDENVLEQEMKLLGGTAEDLDLLAGADSESEVEGDTLNDNLESLDKGMKNILKEIALAQGDVGDDERSADALEDDEQDDNSEAARLSSTSVPEEKPAKGQRGTKGQFTSEPRPEWFEMAEPKVDVDKFLKYNMSKDLIDQLHKYAQSLLDEENQKFKNSQQSSSAHSFYNTVITSGTLSDKISALTLAVQESPVHNVKALETLIGLAGKRSRSQAVDVLRALKDLFAQGSLLPQSRKLYAFQAQPTLPYLFKNTKNWQQGQELPRGLNKEHLVVWAFESWLKEQYFEILKILENWCNDEIEFSKARAVSYVYELLKERPEQESNLLRLLVNKLGDPVKKIASQASHLLMQLLISHPAMKMVVVSAIESDFIFRPGQSLHGKYYAVITFNQTALSGREEDVAVKLLDIYFGLFTGLLKTDEKPAPPKKEADDDHAPEFRGRRRKPQKPKVAPGQIQAEELREKLVSAILTGVNRAYPYTTSADTSNNAFSSHLDTLFRITHSANFNTSIQSLMLIQQISQASQHKASSDRFYRVLYESLLDPRLIIASKSQLYLNLLHRALKADLHVDRVKAFVKRLVQVLSLHEPSFICGAFFLIQDLVKTLPSIKSLIDEPEDHEGGDDVEVFRDVPDEDDEPSITTPTTPTPDSDQTTPRTTYDAHKRDPLHANTTTTCVWELLPFLAHFHPSVSVSAENLLSHRPLSGKPDLSIHTLSHFLDRFVYRNPKLASTGLRGSSIMQSMATDNTQAVLISGTAAGRSLPVNSEQFRTKKSDEVAVEDVFFHKYFSSIKKAGLMSAKEKKRAERKKLRTLDDDEDEEGSDADEDEIWNAMKSSARDLEGDEFEDDVDGDELDLANLDSDDELGDDEDVDMDDLPDNGEDDDEEVDFDPAFVNDDDMPNASSARVSAEIDAIPTSPSDFAGFDSDADINQPAKKTKKSQNAKDKAQKKKLKNLPTFASVEDYAKMLEDDEDEDR